jgi:hypothetical protein
MSSVGANGEPYIFWTRRPATRSMYALLKASPDSADNRS